VQETEKELRHKIVYAAAERMYEAKCKILLEKVYHEWWIIAVEGKIFR